MNTVIIPVLLGDMPISSKVITFPHLHKKKNVGGEGNSGTQILPSSNRFINTTGKDVSANFIANWKQHTKYCAIQEKKTYTEFV